MIDKQKRLPIYLYKKFRQKEDKLLFVAKDSKKWTKKWDVMESDLTFYSDVDFYSRTIMMKKQLINEEPKVVFDSKEFNTEPAIHNGKILILTNENASNLKLMITNINKPESKYWKPFKVEKKDVVLKTYLFTKDFCNTSEKKNVITKLFLL